MTTAKIEKFPKELDDVCKLLGAFIEYWGFKEIEGRIWGHILLSNRPLCPSDLMIRTGLSKGLISVSLTRLIDYNVIKKSHIEGRKTQYYVINENITEVIVNVLKHRERKMLTSILSVIKTLEKLPKSELGAVSLKRLKYLSKITNIACRLLDILIFGGKPIRKMNFDRAPSLT